MTKADLIWCFESFNTADGYFDRDQKRKTMLSYIDWIAENIVPMQKEVFPEEDGAPVSVTVRVLDDEPGGGKTRYALLKIVPAAPTCIGGRSTRFSRSPANDTMNSWHLPNCRRCEDRLPADP